MNKPTRIVLIEDDIVIRQLILSALKPFNENLEIYTSGNGVEGLGLVFAVDPAIIIVDLTLPKYSGKEIIEFITNNNKFSETTKLILALHEREEPEALANLPINTIVIKKDDRKFLDNLKNHLAKNIAVNQTDSNTYTIITKQPLIKKVSKFSNFKTYLANLTINISNKADCAIRDADKNTNILVKVYKYAAWVIYEYLTAVLLAFDNILIRKVKDSNLEQINSDNLHLRTRHYPAFASFVAALILISCQLVLILSGSFVVFNTRITSVMALLESSEVTVDFNNTDYNTEEIVLKDNIFSLKEIVQVVDETPQNILEEPPVESSEEVIVPQPEEEVIEPEITVPPETPIEEPVEIENPEIPEEVLGASTSTIITYPNTNPSITFKSSTEYTNLISILEESNLNNKESSIDFNIVSGNNAAIKYQLSPDGISWFYFSLENKWEKTTNGYESSNNIQTINRNLPTYSSDVGQTGQVFIKAYLHSDGATQINLNKLTVVRDLNIITEVEEVKEEEKLVQELVTLDLENAEPVSFTEDGSEPVSYAVGLEDEVVTVIPSPIILNAAYANGNKIVEGRIDGVEISEAELANYTVRVYFTNSTDIKVPASTKAEYIGETELQQINISNLKQYIFDLRAASIPGGYVAAELVYTKTDGSEIVSNLSKPLHNATFTVNETGDQADTSAGDGSCDRDAGTPGSQCTFRAAIQEANALAGTDNIYFNIPTSDSGYRDYDTPNTPSSGDSNGDDYWTIRPTSAYPNITTAVVIDGSTQQTNQGDTNTDGLEIEINGVSAPSDISGITSSGASASLDINALVVNNFPGTNGIGIKAAGTYFEVTNSYIGLTVNGRSFAPNRTAIFFDTTTTVKIGNDTSDGNVIAGSGNGIYTGHGASSTSVTIRGNVMGTDKDVTTVFGTPSNPRWAIYKPPGSGINIEIGGPSAIHRNYINVPENGVRIDYSDSPTHVIKINNNFFCTNKTGTAPLGSNRMYGVYLSFALTSSTVTEIGGPGKGNLFRYCTSGGIVVSRDKGASIQNNTFADIGTAAISISSDIIINPSTDIDIINNHFGISNSDPYFGLATGKNKHYDIYATGSDFNAKGNYFSGADFMAILVEHSFWSPAKYSNPQIGGTASLTGSLCGGTEKNCFSDNEIAAVIAADTKIKNDSTFATDNTFTNVPLALRQVWRGSFELFTGTTRRNDLADNAFTSTLPSNLIYESFWYNWDKNFYLGNPSNPAGYGTDTGTPITNYTANCPTGSDCPAAGHTTGTNAKTAVLAPTNATFFFPESVSGYEYLEWWMYGFEIRDYDVMPDGSRTTPATIKFDEPHLVSPEFSFDGNSTSEPINTGSARVLGGYTYNDRGHRWVNNPTATGNPATTDYGTAQSMEVEVVDANPVLQQDGSYIITVDSTSDEDNVSLSGYDDGGGAYSGGGTNGSSGLPNGKTSLREAIIVANNHAGTDYIHFNIPTTDTGYRDFDDPNTNSSGNSAEGDDYWTIRPATVLPTISEATIIDATTQTANQGDHNTFGPEIELNGVTKSFSGIITNGSTGSLTVKSLSVNNFQTGISLMSLTAGTISGNYVGTNIKGTASQSNSSTGINISNSSNLTIGGVSATDRNVISGNSGVGLLCGGTSSNNDVLNNFIGTNAEGNAAVANGSNGFDNGGCDYTLVNTNLISGNLGIGLRFQNALEVIVTGNKIGTDVSGMNAIPNQGSTGVFIRGGNIITGKALDSRIGGDTVAERNIISGNTGIGISVGGGDVVKRLEIKGNYIGIAADGTTPLPNSSHALAYSRGEDYILENNIIYYTVGTGVFLNTTTPVLTGASIRNNKISGTSTTVPIDNLLDNGTNNLTANDSGDVDTGPNEGMNFPVITKVEYLGGGQYKISGTLDANSAEAPYEIEICESSSHSSGYGGCLRTLDNLSVMAVGEWNSTITISGDDGTQDRVFTTLATNNLGSTSEFSANFSNINLVIYPLTLTFPSANQTINTTTTLLDWNASNDPDIDRYEVYVDGQFVASVNKNTTQFLLTQPLSLGSHTWQVVAYRANNTEGGRSNTGSFNVELSQFTFEPIYPINIEIDTTLPLLSWGNISLDASAVSYLIYIDDELVETLDSSITQYQITSELAEGQHTWQIIALNEDGQEVGRTEKASFVVDLIEILPTTATDTNEPEQASDTKNESSIGGISTESLATAIPLIALATISTVTATSLGGMNILGVAVGGIIKKRKKYFGIIYDQNTLDVIPLATVLITDINGKVVGKDISDMEGRYGVLLDQQGSYIMEVKTTGYERKILNIVVDNSREIVQDIALIPKENSMRYGLLKYPRKQKLLFVEKILIVITSIGFIYTLIATLTSPILFNFILLAFYLLILCINLYFNFRKLNLKKGKILDKENNLGIKGAIIRAYIDDALVDMKMSNSQGEVRMRVKENTQDLVVTGLGYKTANEQRNIQKEKGDFVPIYLEKDLSGSKVKFGLEK